MTFAVRSALVLGLAFLASACDVKHEKRTCIYNNVQVDCAAFDARNKPQPTATPSQDRTKTPVSPVPTPPKTDQARNLTSCMDAAEKAQLFRDQIALVCAMPTENSAPCIAAADKAQLFREQIASVCVEAKPESATCIEEADRRGLFREQIVSMCR